MLEPHKNDRVNNDPADCGLTHATDEGIRNRLKEVAPEHANEIDGMKFGEIKKSVFTSHPTCRLLSQFKKQAY